LERPQDEETQALVAHERKGKGRIHFAKLDKKNISRRRTPF